MVSGGKAGAFPLQVQPSMDGRDAWEALAREEHLAFEALALSLPPLMEDGPRRREAIDWHRRCGRTRALHGAFIDINPVSGDPAIAAASQLRIRQSCEAAREIGASHVVVHCSCFPFLRGAYLDSWAQQFAAFLDGVAEEFGLTLCAENSMDADPDPLLAVMRQARSPKVCVCLDIGHAAYSRAPLDKWFDALGPYIGYLHLSDNLGSFDDHLPIGEGAIDWAQADRLYRALGRSLPMTLEIGSPEAARRSIAYLRTNGYFGLESCG